MAYTPRDFTGGLSGALTNTFKMLSSIEDEKLQRDRLAKQDARQAELDAQNKQLFNLKIAEANRAKKLRADEEAYLRGITQPDAYGLKVGTEQVVEKLGQYGENPRAKAALAAGPGSKAYEQYFKEMEQLGSSITGQSIDDRSIGFAAANPENIFAAREALKAGIARKAALDLEAKNLADKKSQIALKALTTGGLTKSTGKGRTTGGYSVKDPGSVLKDAYSLIKTQYGKKSGDKIDPKIAQQATLMADAGYDAAQIAKAVNEAYTPSKVETFLGIDWLNPDSAAKFNTSSVNLGTPRNIAANTVSGLVPQITRLEDLGKMYDKQLSEVQTQREGEVGLAELNRIINGVVPAPKSKKAKQKIVNSAVEQIIKYEPVKVKEKDKKIIKDAVEAIVKHPAPTKQNLELINKAAVAKNDKELQKRAQALSNSMKTSGLGPMSEKNKAQWEFIINSFTNPIKSIYDTYQENIGQPFADIVNKYAPGGHR